MLPIGFVISHSRMASWTLPWHGTTTRGEVHTGVVVVEVGAGAEIRKSVVIEAEVEGAVQFESMFAIMMNMMTDETADVMTTGHGMDDMTMTEAGEPHTIDMVLLQTAMLHPLVPWAHPVTTHLLRLQLLRRPSIQW